jgi:glycosyltransferase involved in cell wall biosynthesis
MRSNQTRVDLHLHSKHSKRAADWVLRRLDFPASASEPVALHRALRRAGMEHVTLTDQNTIEGCLEIAHLPGVFLSEEVSTRFPGEECRVNVLVWGITEAQHRMIAEARENIFELQGYLAAEGIAHAVAHPFHAVNGMLGLDHLRKLVLVFRHFEGVNGRFCGTVNRLAREVLGGLTPRDIEVCVAATGLEPTHDEPWRKVLTGGSDDHGGTRPGCAWTAAGGGGGIEGFLREVREGRCEAGGSDGGPLVMAHATYSTAIEYAKERLPMNEGDPTAALLEKIGSRFMEGKDPTEFSMMEKLGFLAQGVVTGRIFDMARGGNISLWKQLSEGLSRSDARAVIARETAKIAEPERRAFVMANVLANKLGYRLAVSFIEQITRGKLLESVQSVIPLVPIGVLLGPYIQAFRLPRRSWMREVAGGLGGGRVPEFLGNRRRAWFTDTLEDVNGVATTIRKMAAAGVAAGKDVTIMTCRSEAGKQGVPLVNFEPVGEFELPEYELQRLSFPPVLNIIDYLERGGFSELIISTPGPVGLAALAAAKSLGLRTVGIYHTDFPQYVRILTDDSFMETLTWNYMHWFHSQLDVLYVNSEDYRKCWIERGIPAARLRILPRGLDTVLFHPTRREAGFWRERGLGEDEVGVLFVGRVSKEKNLDLLVEALRMLEGEVVLRPLVVGDGPYMGEMRRLLPRGIFTGYLGGEELAAAYASADLFAFPSTTDTFGNVILEAQASGLPVVVSDIGGPRDLVEDGVDGLVTRGNDVESLVVALRRLAGDGGLRRRMGVAGRRRVETRDWSEAFEKFWAGSPE